MINLSAMASSRAMGQKDAGGMIAGQTNFFDCLEQAQE
jgi:hypothetical protein